MTDSEVVGQIAKWCLEDEGWRQAFGIHHEQKPTYRTMNIGVIPWSHWHTTEPLVVIEDGEDAYAEEGFAHAIPLTHLLMHPETVRVCFTKIEMIGPAKYFVLAHLRNLGESENRIEYYRDTFLKLFFERHKREGE